MYSLYLGFNYPAAIKPTAYVSVEQQYTTEDSPLNLKTIRSSLKLLFEQH